MVARQTGLDGLTADGIIGLAPTNDVSWVRSWDAQPELFIDKAYEQGVIDERVFSLLIGAGEKEQAFTIGGYDLESFAKSDLVWHQNANPSYWSVKLDGFAYDDQYISISHDEAIVDSGTSYIIMPEAQFFQVLALLQATHGNCGTSNVGMTIIQCECDLLSYYDFPELTFKIDGIEYRIPRSSYVSMYGYR